MHGSQRLTEELLKGYCELSAQYPQLMLIAFPPFVYLQQASRLLTNSCVKLGAQNMNAAEEGAFTGEIAAHMLRDVGCQYVLLGHSERRHLYHETDEMIAAKWVSACRAGLRPIVCVGETLEQRKEGDAAQAVLTQISALLNNVERLDWLAKTVIAYEPVWAIGTGQSATAQEAQKIHAMIRHWVAARDAEIAKNLCILYGGSVKPDNAADFFQMADIDGVLVGGASVKLESFAGICQCSNGY